MRSVSVWMRYSAAARSASTWSIRCSRRSVRSSILRIERSSFFSERLTRFLT